MQDVDGMSAKPGGCAIVLFECACFAPAALPAHPAYMLSISPDWAAIGVARKSGNMAGRRQAAIALGSNLVRIAPLALQLCGGMPATDLCLRRYVTPYRCPQCQLLSLQGDRLGNLLAAVRALAEADIQAGWAGWMSGWLALAVSAVHECARSIRNSKRLACPLLGPAAWDSPAT